MDIDFTTYTSISIFTMMSFVFVASVTPGPNNLMLATSALNFGMRRSLPHMAGIILGFEIMVLCACLGLGKMFEILPWLQTALTYIGGTYLVYLAYRIGTASTISQAETPTQPFKLIEAALFQWVNPKAWMGAITLSSAFGLTAANLITDMTILILVSACVTLPCLMIWAGFGTVLRRWLTDTKHLRRFNITMAVLLIATVPFMIFKIS